VNSKGSATQDNNATGLRSLDANRTAGSFRITSLVSFARAEGSCEKPR